MVKKGNTDLIYELEELVEEIKKFQPKLLCLKSYPGRNNYGDSNRPYLGFELYKDWPTIEMYNDERGLWEVINCQGSETEKTLLLQGTIETKDQKELFNLLGIENEPIKELKLEMTRIYGTPDSFYGNFTRFYYLSQIELCIEDELKRVEEGIEKRIEKGLEEKKKEKLREYKNKLGEARRYENGIRKDIEFLHKHDCSKNQIVKEWNSILDWYRRAGSQKDIERIKQLKEEDTSGFDDTWG